jgi:sulfate permease, SulP family
MAGCAMIGQSVINIRSGGRARLSTLAAGGFLLFFILVLAKWLVLIPMIVGYAEVAEPDLLVLGTHGYGAIGRALIGSVSSRVVRAATCPMLLIPAALWAPHTAGAEPRA